MIPRRALIYLMVAVCFITACSDVRHPLDDSEERPETEALAIDEAEQTLDTIGDSVLGGSSFNEDTWSGDGCETPPFAPSQGEVGLVLIRTYAADALDQVGSPEELLEEYESFWTDLDESVSRSSPNMDPGVVSRVNAIGYELVSVPPEMMLRAFIPCY
jgi:hypothetical protein